MYAFCGWRKKSFSKLAAPLFWQLIHTPGSKMAAHSFQRSCSPSAHAKKVFDFCINRPIGH